VDLHGLHETDEAAALESTRMRAGLGDLRTGQSRTSLLRCQCWMYSMLQRPLRSMYWPERMSMS
jgi:hypothetical protein